MERIRRIKKAGSKSGLKIILIYALATGILPIFACHSFGPV